MYIKSSCKDFNLLWSNILIQCSSYLLGLSLSCHPFHYHAILMWAFVSNSTHKRTQKYEKRKKELNGIHGLLTDFFIFPGQFFTTNMEFGKLQISKNWHFQNLRKIKLSTQLGKPSWTFFTCKYLCIIWGLFNVYATSVLIGKYCIIQIWKAKSK